MLNKLKNVLSNKAEKLKAVWDANSDKLTKADKMVILLTLSNNPDHEHPKAKALKLTYEMIKKVDQIGLTQEEINESVLSIKEEFIKDGIGSIKVAVSLGDYAQAVYILNNNKYNWPITLRESLVKEYMGETYVIDELGDVNTVHGAKKVKKEIEKAKERARQEKDTVVLDTKKEE